MVNRSNDDLRSDDGTRSDGFLSRWARRKQDVLAGKPVVDPVAKPSMAQTTALPIETADLAINKAVAQSNIAQAATDNIATGVPADANLELPPAPTLEDASALTPGSDFKPFMASNVSPEVKNAAMKKLFADPHYNVMDMMDTYVDDYSKPDPMPESMLKQLVSAKFLRLFEDDEEEQGKQASKPVATSQASIVSTENSEAGLQAALPPEDAHTPQTQRLPLPHTP
jgi:Protein of unknown function (DUF3306)